MVYKKIISFLLCLAIFAPALAQNKLTDEPKKYEIPVELEGKAINLLNNLAREAEQFYLAENRITSRILVADLLWDHDEKQARAIFQNAVADLNSMIGQIAPETAEGMEELYVALNRVRTLRTELLLVLAARDPKLALDALQTLTAKNAEGENLFADDKSLELSIASQIADKDPKQAYELAKKNLEGDLDNSVFSALEDIYKKDAELGAKLAKDIVAKIKERRVSSPYDYMSNSNRPAYNSNSSSAINENPTINVWQVQMFLDSVKRLNRHGLKENKTPVLSEAEIKGIVEMLAQKYLNQPYLSSYEVAKIMPDITKYFPATAQAIRRKLSANPGGGDLDVQIRTQTIQDEIADKTVDEILQLGEKKPVGERDDFYRQAAEKIMGEGDVLKAKELYGKIKKKPEYDYLGDRIEAELPLALAKSGDLRATRDMLAKLKTPEERIDVLTNLAVGIAAKGDKKTAAILIEEARSIYSGKMKKRKNLSSVLQIGFAYSTVEPPQSFTMIENNLSFINDVIAAGILLDEFNEMGSVESDEVRLEVVQSESYRNLRNGVAMFRNLAAADFERLTSMADRFSRSEARFFARFRIAEALLNADAEENELQMQKQADERYYID